MKTLHGLDGLGIKSRWGARFSALVQTIPGDHPASCIMGAGSFPGVQRPGHGVDPSLPSNAEVKERVELYFYPPIWAFVACSVVNLTFNFYLFIVIT